MFCVDFGPASLILMWNLIFWIWLKFSIVWISFPFAISSDELPAKVKEMERWKGYFLLQSFKRRSTRRFVITEEAPTRTTGLINIVSYLIDPLMWKLRAERGLLRETDNEPSFEALLLFSNFYILDPWFASVFSLESGILYRLR